jgi:hypothetical protein
MSDAPVFSLESVNALVPRLNALIGEQVERRALIEAKLGELAERLGDPPEDLDPVATEPVDTARLRADAKALILEYRAGWKELEDMGAVVKDPKRGLLDFYGRVEGELVWLCWMYGEDEVSHYHGLEEGFPGRKAIAHAVKKRLLN